MNTHLLTPEEPLDPLLFELLDGPLAPAWSGLTDRLGQLRRAMVELVGDDPDPQPSEPLALGLLISMLDKGLTLTDWQQVLILLSSAAPYHPFVVRALLHRLTRETQVRRKVLLLQALGRLQHLPPLLDEAVRGEARAALRAGKPLVGAGLRYFLHRRIGPGETRPLRALIPALPDLIEDDRRAAVAKLAGLEQLPPDDLAAAEAAWRAMPPARPEDPYRAPEDPKDRLFRLIQRWRGWPAAPDWDHLLAATRADEPPPVGLFPEVYLYYDDHPEAAHALLCRVLLGAFAWGFKPEGRPGQGPAILDFLAARRAVPAEAGPMLLEQLRTRDLDADGINRRLGWLKSTPGLDGLWVRLWAVVERPGLVGLGNPVLLREVLALASGGDAALGAQLADRLDGLTDPARLTPYLALLNAQTRWPPVGALVRRLLTRTDLTLEPEQHRLLTSLTRSLGLPAPTPVDRTDGSPA